ncbi:MAG: polyprenyl synthetase family protein [Candidatus Micrarchaeota archaeon]|nr:polyprenyl synthetase family protein [Candidatus Micrarchaeota archaeon]
MEIEEEIAQLTYPVRERLDGLFKAKREPFEVYGILSEFLSIKGKLLRPALCLASCKAVGGKAEDALHAATAVELFHNFTLIHDDIEDGSLLRRGRPCMHIKYGVPLALNAGDGLFMLVWKEALLIKKNAKTAQEELLNSFTGVLEGQAIELGWYWKDNWDVKRGDYYKVIEGKTGSLIAGACKVGGIIGGGSARQVEALYEFGMGIGTGFQIMDDVLNIIGDEKKYGKEIGGDIVEGKRTLIVVEALERLKSAQKDRLIWILKKKKKTTKEVKEALLLLRGSGAVECAVQEAKRRIELAKRRLEDLPDGSGRTLLGRLAEYITSRQR